MLFQAQFSKILLKATFCHSVLLCPSSAQTFQLCPQHTGQAPGKGESPIGSLGARAITGRPRHQANVSIRSSTAAPQGRLPSRGSQHQSGNQVPPFLRPVAQQTLLPASLQSPSVTFTRRRGECQACVLQMRPAVGLRKLAPITQNNVSISLTPKRTPRTAQPPRGAHRPFRWGDGMLCSGERHPLPL